MIQDKRNVVVIGGGISGIQASLDLADNGIKVDLIERSPCIGGRMAQLDKTFPTNDCSICILSPKLAECNRHPNITIHTLSTVENISKNGENYDIKVKQKARYVIEDRCINCGVCNEECPSNVLDEFDMKLRKRKAIYLYYLQGIPAVMAIDKEHCIHLRKKDSGKDLCRNCQKACPKDAIDFDQKDTMFSINAEAVIVATGYEQFDPIKVPQYRYKKSPNIITGLEFERLICASGPTLGHLVRLSDKKPPKTIAFVQCVGSRDIKNNKYCSSVCCTYSTKEAILAYEHDNEVKSYIFYIDLRAGGKGFRKYIERAKKEYNVEYVKGVVSDIKIDDDKSPIIYYEDIFASEIKSKKVDMVVLASTMIPSKGIENLAGVLNIDLDKYNFIKTDSADPLSTSKSGIFACGACREPMDIPSSVIEASGAVAKVLEYINQNN